MASKDGRPSIGSKRSVSTNVVDSSVDDVLSTIKPFLQRLQDSHEQQSAISGIFDERQQGISELLKGIQSIRQDVDGVNSRISKIYHSVATVSAEVEHTAFDTYLVSLGVHGRSPNEDLEIVHKMGEFAARLNTLKKLIASVAAEHETRNALLFDESTGEYLTKESLRLKIDSLQENMERIFANLNSLQARQKRLCAVSTTSEPRRRSGGRTLRFVDLDDGDDESSSLPLASAPSTEEKRVHNDKRNSKEHAEDLASSLSWLDTSNLSPDNPSPQISPAASHPPHPRRYFPPSVTSQSTFRNTKRRQTWRQAANALHQELERPCLSFHLYSALSTDGTTEASSSSSDASTTENARARRRFCAVKSTQWTKVMAASPNDSLVDAALVGDLAKLLSQSISISQLAHHAINGTNAPSFSPLKQKAAVTPSESLGPSATTLRMPALQSKLDAFLQQKVVYTYKVKPPPPPPVAPPPPPTPASAPISSSAPTLSSVPAPANAAIGKPLSTGASLSKSSVAAPVVPATGTIKASIATTTTPLGTPQKAAQAPLTPAAPLSIEDEIRSLYEKHNPSKLSEIPALLEKHKGKEQQLLERIRKKYESASTTTPIGVATAAVGAMNTSGGATPGVFGAGFGNSPMSQKSLFGDAVGARNAAATNPTGGMTPFANAAAKASPAAAPVGAVGGGLGGGLGMLGGATTTGSSLFSPSKPTTATAGTTGNTLFASPNSHSNTLKPGLFGQPPLQSATATAAPTTPFGAGWGGGANPGGNGGNSSSIQRQIEDIYRQYNPSKLAEVPDLLLKYNGRELELLQKMQKKYLSSNAPPAATTTPGSAALGGMMAGGMMMAGLGASPAMPTTSLFHSPTPSATTTTTTGFGGGFGSPGQPPPPPSQQQNQRPSVFGTPATPATSTTTFGGTSGVVGGGNQGFGVGFGAGFGAPVAAAVAANGGAATAQQGTAGTGLSTSLFRR